MLCSSPWECCAVSSVLPSQPPPPHPWGQQAAECWLTLETLPPIQHRSTVCQGSPPGLGWVKLGEVDWGWVRPHLNSTSILLSRSNQILMKLSSSFRFCWPSSRQRLIQADICPWHEWRGSLTKLSWNEFDIYLAFVDVGNINLSTHVSKYIF